MKNMLMANWNHQNTVDKIQCRP